MKPYKEVVAEVLGDFKAPDALERVARVAIKGNGRPADNWSFRKDIDAEVDVEAVAVEVPA